MVFIVMALVGIVSGIVGALIGLGGGVILVPALLFLGTGFAFFPELSPQQIVGLSVIMMIFTGLSSTLAYMKVGTVDYKSGIIFFAGSAPGTVIGAFVNKNLDLPSFNLYFGILLVLLSLLLLIRDHLKEVHWFVDNGRQTTFIDKQQKEYIYGYPIWFALLLTFFVGFASGLFGIGGGSIIVPAMILLFLFPPHVAIGTSMFMVFLSAIINSITHISLGHVPWIYTAAVVPGAYIGAKLGARLNKHLNSETLVIILRLVLLVLGLRSIYEGIFSS
ncbi:sulfite exporter TauE/SafE family protein [Microbacterium sp. APC 3898]|uniref:Probable membrane transporter protein n=2 Tax=Planococcus TaxID=1372 RepID=A0ABT7ZNT2_9BACL|nr:MULTISPECIES: sulfite exporter TauE/SafE family protein [Terrabacteria group]MBF6635038.1 sulfite exporter TauE/SafE family protein [Planococcus sp. (in: firmicutes)]MBD8016327.1 sulfite exporter TauE/SafE family protein [Planococcus wigleyi]MDN3428823.1 sulfite exporter TauE/SafE family protein [Planococcus sp. APC 4016]MDN3439339.1 sulfite exporter TauE/SafE family protein [Planococcus sp. APC 3900]MDN3500056.1 sulfite exporter TauE/SafE family protein [Microbacterium sp. APC 3898]